MKSLWIVMLLAVLAVAAHAQMPGGSFSGYTTSTSMNLTAAQVSDKFSNDQNTNSWVKLPGSQPVILQNGTLSGTAAAQVFVYNSTLPASDDACHSVVIAYVSLYTGGNVSAAAALTDTSEHNYAANFYYDTSLGYDVVQLSKNGQWLGPTYHHDLVNGDSIGICSRAGYLSMSFDGQVIETWDDSANALTNLRPGIYFGNGTPNWVNGWQLSVSDGSTNTHLVHASATLAGITSPCSGSCTGAEHTPSLTVQTSDGLYGGTVTGAKVSPTTGINLTNAQDIPEDWFVGQPGTVDMSGSILCTIAGPVGVGGNDTTGWTAYTFFQDMGPSDLGDSRIRKVQACCDGGVFRRCSQTPNGDPPDYNLPTITLPEGVSAIENGFYMMRGSCQGPFGGPPSGPCQQSDERKPRTFQIGYTKMFNFSCTQVHHNETGAPPTGNPEK